MGDISLSVDIDAPASLVWQLIAEFARWPEWGPTVNSVQSEHHEVATGATGRVMTPLGASIPFVVTEVEAGFSWTWRVGGVRATGHRVTPTSDETCRLEFSVPWIFAPYALVLRIGLARVRSIAESKRG